MLEEGRWQEAEPFVRETLEITRKLSAAPGPRYATAMGNLGRVFEQKGDFKTARDCFEQAMQILNANGMKDSSSSAKVLLYESTLELDQGDTSEAIRLANQALSIQTSLGGDSNPQRASGLLTLGLAHLLGGDAAAAEESFRRALAIRQRTFPPTHPELLIAKARIAEALLEEKEPQGALDQIDSALAAARAAPYPLLNWRMAELRVLRGLALRELGREREALDLLRSNASALQGYNMPAVRTYLLKRIELPHIKG